MTKGGSRVSDLGVVGTETLESRDQGNADDGRRDRNITDQATLVDLECDRFGIKEAEKIYPHKRTLTGRTGSR
eukprot:CAMPEP_0117666106 /NCGR_PEP_ID=MMETSP0804-20121206/10187_1 /TAXON_ID=1074897 /ORGANISM="Tetraselmis astigmatica, Strain CCMP880" /LENGTH=72 /DNA_ID=CAMNT_0005473605 /DNA_START=357 /DNA_END=573 /DNA_ORIENTATION=-